ncbi:DAACS family dicarboxylate/amino acid:cation Na+ or H+ symporter [[Clostridium] ultunense Esp]|uniref:DAACS family dicarboxylate/amino acid:cation Na+ or H+ symporter n=1 Tax=[Clostridium] ultunense Esp TaxID=1288971 RepID=M1Z4S3_9FIRM|nr:dicarboxylate/amino acid:cation symporter [Schnuerera ultunensis]CCQ92739.1 DAACS family dicarboxylate/amino acid:cation Na+ or H+ symporter [[Clostridium] ultunense Esp]SHD76217.1 DAACS family dicarboxylate/amino acid:cation Na+ or H+ symporter [[Clostridium] ultunense Esp]
MRRMGLLPKLIIAIILGIIIGNFAPAWVVRILATFNSLFGNFLGFAIPLIIIGFVAPGIGDLGEEAGKLLAITAGIAYGSTIISGALAYFTSSIVLPMFLTPGVLNVAATNPEEALLQAYFEVDMPPIFGVMTALLIAFTLGLGIAAIKGDTIKRFMSEFQSIIEKLISSIIIPLLPFHILGIFANMTYAGQVATILSVFARVFVMVILLHITVLIIQFIIGGAVAGGNPFRLLKNMVPAYFTAVGTQSSAATIPVTLEQTKKNGVQDGIADFVIPLCATIHLSGSTITLVSCSMAIMMLNGMTTSFRVMFPFILMLGVTMVAAPGVPGGAVIAALGLLETMLGFPSAMLSLMIALYVAQDSFGTATNVTGDGAIALMVNRISGYRLEY